MAAVLGVAAVVCVAAAVAGEMLQDLKVGHILGGTPWKMQVGDLIGVALAAAVMFFPLVILHQGDIAMGGTGLGGKAYPAPQASLMAILAQGIVGGDMAWPLIIVGMLMAFGFILVQVKSPMLVCVGMYLPLETSFAIFIGGLIKGVFDSIAKRRGFNEAQTIRSGNNGMLLAAGLIAGEALIGLLFAGAGRDGDQVRQVAPGPVALLPGALRRQPAGVRGHRLGADPRAARERGTPGGSGAAERDGLGGRSKQQRRIYVGRTRRDRARGRSSRSPCASSLDSRKEHGCVECDRRTEARTALEVLRGDLEDPARLQERDGDHQVRAGDRRSSSGSRPRPTSSATWWRASPPRPAASTSAPWCSRATSTWSARRTRTRCTTSSRTPSCSCARATS